MEEKEFESLERGNIIKNKGSGESYVVTGNYGKCGVMILKAILAMNPSEWEKVEKE